MKKITGLTIIIFLIMVGFCFAEKMGNLVVTKKATIAKLYGVTEIDSTTLSTLGASIELNTLNDVTLSSPITNHVLKYNGSEWVNVENVETDPIFLASDVYSVTSTQISNWDTAYGWGDHSVVGYLTIETDPIFLASPANSITDAGSGVVISSAERIKVGYLTVTQPVDLDTLSAEVDVNNAKVSADGSINTHSDVEITTPSSDQILKYNGTKWTNSTLDVAYTLQDLTDTGDTIAATSDLFLLANGTSYEATDFSDAVDARISVSFLQDLADTGDTITATENFFLLVSGQSYEATNFDTEVSANSDVTANTTHTATVTGNPHAIDIADLNSTGDSILLTSGLFLISNGTSYEAVDFTTQASSDIALDTLSDVDVSAPTDGYVLTWDDTATEWTAEVVAATFPVPGTYWVLDESSTDLVFSQETGFNAIRTAGGNARGVGSVDLQLKRSNDIYVASCTYSVISGGENNGMSGGTHDCITGGSGNNMAYSGNYNTITGGVNNTMDTSTSSTIIGGANNKIDRGYYSTILGGHYGDIKYNTDYAMCGGRRPQIQAGHDGVFLWADSTDANFDSIIANEVAFRCSGGFRINNASLNTFQVNADGTMSNETSYSNDLTSGTYRVLAVSDAGVFGYTTDAGGGAETLADLTDTGDTILKTDGLILVANGTSYEATQLSTETEASVALDNLSNVDVSAPTDGYVLTWNDTASEWTAEVSSGGALTLAELTDTGDTITATENFFLLVSGQSYEATDFDTEVSANSDVVSNTAHTSTVTGNPHAIDFSDLTSGGDTIAITLDLFLLANGTSYETADFSDSVEALSINNVVEDTTPELGGELDANSNGINFGEWTIIESGNDLIFSPEASANAIRTPGGDARGIYSVDLQVSRENTTNVASGNYSVILGGQNNTASGLNSVVVGGLTNVASGDKTFIGGGTGNNAIGDYDVVSGGIYNVINTSAYYSTVSGGISNTIGTGSSYSSIIGGDTNAISSTSSYSSIIGGSSNDIAGQYSTVGGRRGQVSHQGVFLWADSTDADFVSGATDEVAFRASGGFRINDGSSDVFKINADGSISNEATYNANYTSDTYRSVVVKDDGSFGYTTAAGGLADVVDDTTPELGGNLDANGNNISEIGTLTFDVTDTDPNLYRSAEDTLKTDKKFIIGESLEIASGGATVDIILDEDTLSSDRDDALATQQSIKAYVDTELASVSVDLPAWQITWDGHSADYPNGVTYDAPAATTTTIGNATYKSYGFDTSSAEWIQVQFRIPDDIVSDAGVTIEVLGYAETAESATVAMQWQYSAKAIDETLDGSFTVGTDFNITVDATQNKLIKGSLGTAMDTLSWSAGDNVFLMIGRDPDDGDDDMATDWEQIELRIKIGR